MEREPIGKDAADDVDVRLKALQKLEASIDVITTTAMGAKVDGLQALGRDPRTLESRRRSRMIRIKAAAHDVSAGTKALRRLRRRHKLKQGWARLRPPRWDSTDEDDVFVLQAPATTPQRARKEGVADPTAGNCPLSRRSQGRQTPSPNRKIVRRLVRGGWSRPEGWRRGRHRRRRVYAALSPARRRRPHGGARAARARHQAAAVVLGGALIQ